MAFLPLKVARSHALGRVGMVHCASSFTAAGSVNVPASASANLEARLLLSAGGSRSVV